MSPPEFTDMNSMGYEEEPAQEESVATLLLALASVFMVIAIVLMYIELKNIYDAKTLIWF